MLAEEGVEAVLDDRDGVALARLPESALGLGLAPLPGHMAFGVGSEAAAASALNHVLFGLQNQGPSFSRPYACVLLSRGCRSERCLAQILARKQALT